MSHISPVIKEVSDPYSVEEVFRKNAEIMVKTISRDTKIIAKAAEEGKVMIVPAYYHLDSGFVDFGGN